MELFWWIYFSVVIVFGLLILFRTKVFLDRLENYRKKSLKKITIFSPTSIEYPEDTKKSTKDTGIRSIETRFSFINRIFIPLILIFWLFLIILPFLPIIPAIFSSILVAFLTGIIAITTKPLVENAIAGIVVSLAQPIRIGDTVKIGEYYGTIEEITITHSKLKVWNGQRYIIPNRNLLEKEFINYSIKDESIWAHVEFWVSYDANIDLVESIAIKAAKESSTLLNNEEPSFWIMGLGEDSICCWIAGWTHSAADAWELKVNIRKELIRSFQREGIQTHLKNICFQNLEEANNQKYRNIQTQNLA